MAVRWSAPILVATVLAAGCGDTTGPTASSTSAPDTTPDTEVVAAAEPVGGLVAELGTNRLYAVHRGFGLALKNVTEEPIVISSMQLDSPLFATAAANEREVTLAPGRKLVLPLPYGEVRCDDHPGPTFGIAVVLIDGEELHLDAAEEYAGAVARLHARECAAADVLERVDITWGEDWVLDGVTATGELSLSQRHPGEPVALDDAVGNVIFTLILEDAHPVLEVTDDAPSATVPVTISADRCDPHAVAEFKTPYLFLSWATVGDGDPVPVPLQLTGAARQALVDLITGCST